jgi:cysteine desulfurase
VGFKERDPFLELPYGSFKRFTVAAPHEAPQAPEEEKILHQRENDKYGEPGKDGVRRKVRNRAVKNGVKIVHRDSITYDTCMFSRKRVYLDNASATPIDSRVARAVSEAQDAFFGNPSAPHEEGRQARAAVSAAREKVARSFSVKPEEILFTSGGTESNNLAIHGLVKALVARGAKRNGIHLISTTIEHSSVLKTLAMLEGKGVAVTYVAPEKDGIVNAERVAEAVRPETALITLAHVNSEVGTVQPISRIAEVLLRRPLESAFRDIAPEILFPVIHADAAQSPLYMEAGPHALRASLVSYDAQKVGGPKGVGILYRDFSVPLAPLYGGGSQERSLRPGTENVPAIVGAGVAFELAKEGRKERAERVALIRDYLVGLVLREIPGARLIGSPKHRIANNAHFVIPGVSGEYLSVLMDKEGIAVSPRSACIGSGEPFSYVVQEITGSEDDARATIRFSLGARSAKNECERAVIALAKAVPLAREGDARATIS